MAEQMSLAFRLMKVALIVMHTLVVTSLSFVVLVAIFGTRAPVHLVISILLIESNSWLGIVGAYKESRPLLISTGSVTLILLLIGVFTNSDREAMTFLFLYFLAIVGLSYALSDMIRARGRTTRRTDAEAYPRMGPNRMIATAVPFTALVVSPPAHGIQLSRPVPIFAAPVAADTPMMATFNDSPPPYDDCPPPKYEDAIKEQK